MMCKFVKSLTICVTATLACLTGALAFAQESASGGVEAWRALDDDLRQAMVEEISARQGLDANAQNPDWLIRSPEDIEEALRVSCEIVGGTLCADVIGDGEELELPPGYTVGQGMMNAESIRRTKAGFDGQ